MEVTKMFYQVLRCTTGILLFPHPFADVEHQAPHHACAINQ
jgi:hypothetical protein